MSRLVCLLVACLAALALNAQDAPDPWAALPGYYQFTHDDPVLGALAAGGTLVNLLPLLQPSLSSTPLEYWVEKNGQHYFQWADPDAAATQENRLVAGTTLVAGIWGGFFSIAGDWDFYTKATEAGRAHVLAGVGLGDLLAAPFQAEQVFNLDVFPVFPLLALEPLRLEDYQKIAGYFGRDHVNFAGFQVSPAAGLALTLGTAMLLVDANATVEEIAFRGLYLDRLGVWGSSVFFGANHLLNAFVLPNFSFEDAAQQAVFATLFGAYAAARTEARGGDFRRMVALHFWHNVTSLVLSYLVDPDHAQLFAITIPL